jgi:hypothetical protein
MDCLGEKKEGTNYSNTCQAALEPENDAPRGKGYDYAAYERAECRAWVDVSIDNTCSARRKLL